MTLATDISTMPLPRFSLTRLLDRLFGRPSGAEDAICRQRRDDMLDNADKVADACCCEESMAQMMYLYPGRY